MLIFIRRLNAGYDFDASQTLRPRELVKEGAGAGAPDLVPVGEGDEDLPDLFLVEVRTGPSPASRDYLALETPPVPVGGVQVGGFKERGSGDRLGVLRRQLVEPE